MNLSAPFIRRPVMTTLVTASFVAFGLAAYGRLPVADLPTVDFPTIQVTATLRYSRLVPSVAKHLKVPPEEYAPVEINAHVTTFTVLP